MPNHPVSTGVVGVKSALVKDYRPLEFAENSRNRIDQLDGRPESLGRDPAIAPLTTPRELSLRPVGILSLQTTVGRLFAFHGLELAQNPIGIRDVKPNLGAVRVQVFRGEISL